MFDLCFVPLPPPHHHSGKYNGTRSGCDVCIKDPLSGRCYTCRPLISWHNNICSLMFDIHSFDWKRYTVPNLTSEYVRWLLSWNCVFPTVRPTFSSTNPWPTGGSTNQCFQIGLLLYFSLISSFYLKLKMKCGYDVSHINIVQAWAFDMQKTEASWSWKTSM